LPKYHWILDEPRDRIGRISFNERDDYDRLVLEEGPGNIRWRLTRRSSDGGIKDDRDVTIRQALRDADEAARFQIAAASVAAVAEFESVDPSGVSKLKAQLEDVRSDFADYFEA
jgi:hypothetical protein